MDDTNANDQTQDGAPLVQVDDPSKLTNKDINAATNDGLKPSQDGTPNEAAAETMAANRDAAKKPDDEPERGYFHGQGGAVGL